MTTKKNKVELTDKELDAIFWAITLTKDSFDGWSAEDKGPEVIEDLKALARAESKMWMNSQIRANWNARVEA